MRDYFYEEACNGELLSNKEIYICLSVLNTYTWCLSNSRCHVGYKVLSDCLRIMFRMPPLKPEETDRPSHLFTTFPPNSKRVSVDIIQNVQRHAETDFQSQNKTRKAPQTANT